MKIARRKLKDKKDKKTHKLDDSSRAAYATAQPPQANADTTHGFKKVAKSSGGGGGDSTAVKVDDWVVDENENDAGTETGDGGASDESETAGEGTDIDMNFSDDDEPLADPLLGTSSQTTKTRTKQSGSSKGSRREEKKAIKEKKKVEKKAKKEASQRSLSMRGGAGLTQSTKLRRASVATESETDDGVGGSSGGKREVRVKYVITIGGAAHLPPTLEGKDVVVSCGKVGSTTPTSVKVGAASWPEGTTSPRTVESESSSGVGGASGATFTFDTTLVQYTLLRKWQEKIITFKLHESGKPKEKGTRVAYELNLGDQSISGNNNATTHAIRARVKQHSKQQPTVKTGPGAEDPVLLLRVKAEWKKVNGQPIVKAEQEEGAGDGKKKQKLWRRSISGIQDFRGHHTASAPKDGDLEGYTVASAPTSDETTDTEYSDEDDDDDDVEKLREKCATLKKTSREQKKALRQAKKEIKQIKLGTVKKRTSDAGDSAALTEKLAASEATNADLQKQVRDLAGDPSQLVAMKVQFQLEAKNKEIATQKQQLKEKDTEIISIGEDMVKARKSLNQATETLKKREAELAKESENAKQLQQMLDARTAQHDAAIKDKNAEVERLQASLSASGDEMGKKLSETSDQLATANETLRNRDSELRQAKEALSKALSEHDIALKSKSAELQKATESHAAEVARFQESLVAKGDEMGKKLAATESELSQTKVALSKALSDHDAALKAKDSAISKETERSKNLQESLNAKSAELQKVTEQHVAEVARFQESLVAKGDEINKKLKETSDQLAASNEMLRNRESELSQAKEALSKALADHGVVLKEKEAAVAKETERGKSLQESLDSKTSELQKATDLHAAEIARLRETIASSAVTLKDREGELSQAKEALSKALAEHGVALKEKEATVAKETERAKNLQVSLDAKTAELQKATEQHAAELKSVLEEKAGEIAKLEQQRQSDLKDKSAEIERLQAALTANGDELREKINEASDKLAIANESLRNRDNDLKEAKIALDKVVAQHALVIADRDKEIAVLSENRRAMETKHQEMDKELKSATATIQSRDSDLGKLRASAEEEKKQHESALVVLRKESEDKASALEKTVSERDASLLGKARELEDVNSQLERVKQELEGTKSDLVAREARSAETSSELEKRNAEEIGKLKEEARARSAEIAAREQEWKNADRQRADKAAEIEKEISALTSNIKAKDSDLEKLRAAMEEEKKQHESALVVLRKESEDKASALEKTVSERDASLLGKARELEDVNSQLERVKQELEGTKSDLVAREARSAETSSELEKRSAEEIGKLKEEARVRSAEIAAREQEWKNADRQRADKAVQLEKEISTLTSNIKAKDGDLEKLRASIDEQNKQYEVLRKESEDKVGALERVVSERDANLLGKTREFEDVSSQLQQVKQELEGTKSDLVAREARSAETSSELEKRNAEEIGKLKEEARVRSAEIAAREQEWKNADRQRADKAAELEKEISALNDSIKAKDSDLAKLRASTEEQQKHHEIALVGVRGDLEAKHAKESGELKQQLIDSQLQLKNARSELQDHAVKSDHVVHQSGTQLKEVEAALAAAQSELKSKEQSLAEAQDKLGKAELKLKETDSAHREALNDAKDRESKATRELENKLAEMERTRQGLADELAVSKENEVRLRKDLESKPQHEREARGSGSVLALVPNPTTPTLDHAVKGKPPKQKGSRLPTRPMGRGSGSSIGSRQLTDEFSVEEDSKVTAEQPRAGTQIKMPPKGRGFGFGIIDTSAVKLRSVSSPGSETTIGDSINSNNEKNSSSSNSIGSEKKELESLNDQIEEHKATIAKQTKHTEELTASLRQKEDLLKQAEVKCGFLEQRLQDIDDTNKAGGDRIGELQRQVGEKEQRCRDLEEQHAQQERQISDLRAQIVVLMAESGAVSAKLKDTEIAKAALDRDHAANVEVAAQHDAKTAKHKAKRQQLRDRITNLEEEQRAIAAGKDLTTREILQRDEDAKEAMRSAHKNELEEMEQKAKILEQKLLDDKKRAVAERDSTINSLQKEKHELELRIEQFKERIVALELNDASTRDAKNVENVRLAKELEASKAECLALQETGKREKELQEETQRKLVEQQQQQQQQASSNKMDHDAAAAAETLKRRLAEGEILERTFVFANRHRYVLRTSSSSSSSASGGKVGDSIVDGGVHVPTTASEMFHFLQQGGYLCIEGCGAPEQAFLFKVAQSLIAMTKVKRVSYTEEHTHSQSQRTTTAEQGHTRDSVQRIGHIVGTTALDSARAAERWRD
eukprot:TRINITY_DN1655_c0_g1_i7.p1 TRINITY_DN1655_c0_g1~~TRINITY_DN1655_c0_g1_i7.p1  ORF type:complete len:2278 (-),score=685.07 TRINITY_DN1655_c0_g1_i7:1346-8179(-)